MALSKTELDLLTALQDELERGDMSDIAENLGISRQHVSYALSVSNDFYNEKIVEEAVRIINKRKAKSERMLQSLKIG